MKWMFLLMTLTNWLRILRCTCGNFRIHGTHIIGAKDVSLSIKRLKPNKKDGSSEIVSDYIINVCNSLSIHLALLFTMMLRQGLSPDGMLFGTTVPIPKGRWANLSNSDNFRAITLSSILYKMLHVVILTKKVTIYVLIIYNLVLNLVLQHHYVQVWYRRLYLIM